MKGSWTLAGLVLVGAVALYWVRAERVAELEREVASLEDRAEDGAVVVAEPGGEGAGEMGEPDRDAIYAGIAGGVERRFAEGGREKLGDVLADAELAVAGLDAEELVAVLGYDPALDCSRAVFSEDTPDEEIVRQAILVKALKRLFEIAPELAVPLAVGSGAAGEEIGDVGLHHSVWRGLGEWAKKDFAAATAFMDAHEGEMYMGEVKRYLMLQAYAEADLAGALAYAEERGELREALGYLWRSVEFEDLPVLFEVVERLPEVGWYRSQAYTDFAVKVNNSKGWEAARSFVETYGRDLEWIGGLAAEVAAADVRERPGEKVSWVAGLSGGDAAGNVRRVVEAWSEVDFGGVAEWLPTVDGEPWRDVAVAAFVKKVAPVDPEGAAEWAGTIRSEKVRERLVEELGE